jgi:signal transduction histidine kinase
MVSARRSEPYADAMTTRLSQGARDRLVDLAVVLVVLWFTLAQFGSRGFGEYEDTATAPDGLGFGLVLLTVLPLFWRRQAPFAVLLATLAPSLALAALGYAVHAHIAPAAALYAFAARPERGRLWPVLATAAAGYVALVVVELLASSFSLEDYILPVLIWTGAWLVGDRRRVGRIRALEERDRVQREQQLVVAEERARIARELHDSAGHALNTILVQAGAARLLRESDSERSARAVETIEELARETIEDIDRIVGSLREEAEADRAPLPGVEQIPALVERQRASGLDVKLRFEGEPGRTLPAAVDRAAYRIAQESLTNAARHGAGTAAMEVRRGADALELTVRNPVGESARTRPGGGRGIAGMRERAKLLGGSLEAGRNGAEFHVRARLPYDRAR